MQWVSCRTPALLILEGKEGILIERILCFITSALYLDFYKSILVSYFRTKLDMATFDDFLNNFNDPETLLSWSQKAGLADLKPVKDRILDLKFEDIQSVIEK